MNIISGNIYHCEATIHPYFKKICVLLDDELYLENCLTYYSLDGYTDFKIYKNHDIHLAKEYKYIIKEATNEEIQWLLLCHQAGKYVECPIIQYSIY